MIRDWPALTERLLFLALIGLTIFFLIQPLAEGWVQIARNYNEGWNAYSQWRFTVGQPVYPPLDALYTNNYPPLSYAVVGGLARLGGDQIMVGRAVALAALVVTTLLIGLIVARVGGSGWAASAAMLWFIAYHGAYAADFVALDDPQWLAHAVMTVSLALLLLGQRGTALVLTAVLLGVVAGMVKHAIVSVPIAVTLWLLITDWRRALLWMISGTVLLAMAIFLGELVFPGFVGGILSTEAVRIPSNDREFWSSLWTMGAPIVPAAVLTLLIGIHRWREPAVRLVLIYTVVAGAIGILLLRGGGTTLNMMFDLSIAATIGAGIFLGRMATGEPTTFNRVGRILALLVLVLAVAKALPARAVRFPAWAAALPMRIAETASDLALIRGQTGPVLCESLAMCFWAGKPIEIDFFNAGLKLKAGTVDPERVIAALRAHRWSMIQLELPIYFQPRLPASVSTAIDQSYRRIRSRAPVGELLVPR